MKKLDFLEFKFSNLYYITLESGWGGTRGCADTISLWRMVVEVRMVDHVRFIFIILENIHCVFTILKIGSLLFMTE